ncbi:winged helix-turn-helix domain-containing protein [Micromonospora sp. WMMD1102]|uniref:winged helix-turn-helix domain-containing protein n=1 Tax=Micromonospora sp. WMMD1102 TaxID=3016105 RepID=UPI00241513CF|nr:winged helix-turn-helix domain-containing protein [Micromonospora sp. WMMD1102]MDG4787295.1 winged helix-turn-helix domain-containing protein [Micromonospora sp. WMMD1102]
MSVVAIHPRTPSPAGPNRAGAPRRRSPAAETAPVVRVTVDLPLVGGRYSPELTMLLGLVRQLRDQGADVLTETRLPDGTASALPDGAVSAALPDGASMPAADIGTGLLRVLTAPRVVLRNGRPVPFTRLEFDLLVFLARNPRRVFTRLQLLSNVWGYEHAIARTVDVHVRRLRAKVPPSMRLVTTVHGIGYRLADDAPVRIDDAA